MWLFAGEDINLNSVTRVKIKLEIDFVDSPKLKRTLIAF